MQQRGWGAGLVKTCLLDTGGALGLLPLSPVFLLIFFKVVQVLLGTYNHPS